MNKIRGILMGLLALAGTGVAYAQGMKDMRINEILVLNEHSYADDHANHSGWIELFNSGHSNVDIGAAFLTVKRGDKAYTYRIPKTDARTVIGPQQYVIFFASGLSNRGTFHTNFLLDQTGYLALLDQGGHMVDSVVYDVQAQQPDVSMGRLRMSDDSYRFVPLPNITPMQSNDPEVEIPPSELFRMKDPSGMVMTITAMSVVFTALVVLFLIFKSIGRLMVGIALRRERKALAAATPAETPLAPEALVVPKEEVLGEVIAAIAMALRRYESDMHDIESHVLTINRVAKAYSPWSSKIYTLRQLPNKR